MKKILLINNGYPSKTHPNYVTYIESIRHCLEAAGFKTDLLVLNSDFNSFVGKYSQFFIYYLRLLFFRKYRQYDYIYINNYPYSFLPMIIHFWQMKKIIIHWHGDDIFPGSLFSIILNHLSYKFIRKDTIHITPSKYFAEETSLKLRIRAEDIFVSPSGGVDTAQFFREEAGKRRHGLIRLGFASGLLRSKGIDLVIGLLEDAVMIEEKAHTNIEFHFIDYGKEKDHYVAELLKMKNTVKHAPYPIKRMPEFYNQIDILLFPSLRKAESLGLVALESMSCESPVIATDDFALKDTVIEGVTGERFKVNDLAAFKAAVLKCILNIDTYKPREFVLKNYSKESVSKGYFRQLR